jgi:hypothetical protein
MSCSLSKRQLLQRSNLAYIGLVRNEFQVLKLMLQVHVTFDTVQLFVPLYIARLLNRDGVLIITFIFRQKLWQINTGGRNFLIIEGQAAKSGAKYIYHGLSLITRLQLENSDHSTPVSQYYTVYR